MKNTFIFFLFLLFTLPLVAQENSVAAGPIFRFKDPMLPGAQISYERSFTEHSGFSALLDYANQLGETFAGEDSYYNTSLAVKDLEGDVTLYSVNFLYDYYLIKKDLSLSLGLGYIYMDNDFTYYSLYTDSRKSGTFSVEQSLGALAMANYKIRFTDSFFLELTGGYALYDTDVFNFPTAIARFGYSF